MIHHVVLFKLKPEVTNDKIETMMMTTRMMLLKIPEALSVKCGKKVTSASEWPYFIAVDCESMDKLALYLDHPIYLKFMEDAIKPNITEQLALDYEMEPGKEVKYS